MNQQRTSQTLIRKQFTHYAVQATMRKGKLRSDAQYYWLSNQDNEGRAGNEPTNRSSSRGPKQRGEADSKLEAEPKIEPEDREIAASHCPPSYRNRMTVMYLV